ncbi:MAG: nucleotide sugar dehydrogenase [Pseudomonadota bacterium]
MKQDLIRKIKQKTAVIGVVGLGYVGLPLGLVFAETGYRVLGFDVDRKKVDALNSGRSYIAHLPAERIRRAVESGGFTAAASFDRAGQADALIICVPTPLNHHREPDISFVTGTMETLRPHLRPGQIVSLESTTYPGTTEEELKPRIESRGLVVGRDVFLVFSPEREDPANPHFHTKTIPKVCGGITPACLEVGQALYQAVVDKVVPVSSTRVAELTKLLENIYRAVNIGLVNELKIVADSMGVDIHEVIDAASTKPFGFTPFYPGPGLGGHCIPIDPFYLTWKAREFGVHTRFIELAGEVNRQMPQYVVRKTMDALNDRGKAVRGSRLLILGVAYKKNVDDMRESPAVEIIEMLSRMGAEISYSDPYIPQFPTLRRGRFNLESVALTPEVLAQADGVILVTNHDAFDYDLIASQASLIVDTRGVYRSGANVVKA